MNGYQHLGLDERRDIYRMVATGRSARQIADALGRHPSTIYRELKRNRHLARRSRRQRYGRKPRGLHIPVAKTIGARPQEITDRSSFGHWEGDLLIFMREYGKANLTSLVERRSCLTFLALNPRRHSPAS